MPTQLVSKARSKPNPAHHSHRSSSTMSITINFLPSPKSIARAGSVQERSYNVFSLNDRKPNDLAMYGCSPLPRMPVEREVSSACHHAFQNVIIPCGGCLVDGPSKAHTVSLYLYNKVDTNMSSMKKPMIVHALQSTANPIRKIRNLQFQARRSSKELKERVSLFNCAMFGRPSYQ